MSETLGDRIAGSLSRPIDPVVRAFAKQLAADAGALAVLFYGSNLRTGELEGVLDYYLLLPGKAEGGIWPRVSYHEAHIGGHDVRAKVATMTLEKFGQAASGALRDTTIWARFVQPCALVWCRDDAAADKVRAAVAKATRTASRLAVALGPGEGSEEEYWLALFRATYRAEFRFETVDRARSILDLNRDHFDGLLPRALDAEGISWTQAELALHPALAPGARKKTLKWWALRRRMGKPLNFLRLLKASTTFEGAARYAAWKIERHTGVPVEVTPWRERHPVLAAPGVLFSVWKRRGKG